MPSLLTTALAAASLAVLPIASGAVGPGAGAGPSVVEVPLEQSLEVRPAAGWSFADCGALLEASELVTVCTAEGFTVTGPAYDADIDPVRVAVPLRSVGTGSELIVDYVIRLAEPSQPDAPDTTIDLPLTAGAVSLVPLSDLGLDCGLCSAGEASIEVRKVEPGSAGAARVTGAHLVFSADPKARGSVEVDLRVKDDIGRASKTFKVMLHVSQPTRTPLQGLHLSRPAEALSISAEELLGLPPGSESAEGSEQPGGADEPIIVAACGPALHGAVRCTPGGGIAYEPRSGPDGANGADDAESEQALPDQFSVRLVAPDGRQTLASVTLVAAGDRTPAVLAPASGAERATLQFSLPRPPPQEEEEAPGGAVSGFSDLMDALGAR